eukprot:5628512-Pleurochrysis_carterae.AAC.5
MLWQTSVPTTLEERPKKAEGAATSSRCGAMQQLACVVVATLLTTLRGGANLKMHSSENTAGLTPAGRAPMTRRKGCVPI